MVASISNIILLKLVTVFYSTFIHTRYNSPNKRLSIFLVLPLYYEIHRSLRYNCNVHICMLLNFHFLFVRIYDGCTCQTNSFDLWSSMDSVGLRLILSNWKDLILAFYRNQTYHCQIKSIFISYCLSPSKRLVVLILLRICCLTYMGSFCRL